MIDRYDLSLNISRGHSIEELLECSTWVNPWAMKPPTIDDYELSALGIDDDSLDVLRQVV